MDRSRGSLLRIAACVDLCLSINIVLQGSSSIFFLLAEVMFGDIYQATNKLGGSRSPLGSPCPSCTRSLARSRTPKASVHCSAAGAITPSFMNTNLLNPDQSGHEAWRN